MQQRNTTEVVAPFFNVLSEADEIQVREISSPTKANRLIQLEKLIRNFDEEDGEGRRAFVVVVKGTSAKVQKEASPDPSEEFSRDYLLQSAQLLVSNHDFLLARNVYSFLLKKNIRDSEALKGLGICFFRVGDNTAARKCFRAYYELFSEEEGLLWLALSESSQGNDKQAAEYFGSIKHPEFLKLDLQFEFYKESGNVYNRVGDIERAEARYKSAMGLNPNSDVIFVNLGTLSIQRKRFEAAHTHFLKALTLNPKNARAYCGLGLAALELGQTVFAEKQFEKALEHDPQNNVALSQLINLVEGDTKVTALKMKVERFLEGDRKNSDAKYLHAICEFKLGHYLACQREIEALLKENASHELASRLRSELVKHLQTLGGSV